MTDFEKAYLREKQLRKRAEQLLEDKSRELYESFESLRLAHQNLKQQQTQLISSERMASLGVMAAGIAHEINNPIGYVSSNLNTIKETFADVYSCVEIIIQKLDIAADEPLAKSIRQALDEYDIAYLLGDFADLADETSEGLDRVKQIVADLKSFAHEDTGGMQEVDINDCLRGALNILNNQIKYHAQLDVEYADLPEIKGYYGKLNQVFINLIANANQAVDDQGNIRISTALESGNIVVRVSDDGPGISSEHIDQLFTPFFTTKPVGEGTGLGLSISQGVIEEHGGVIEVSSTPGKGACFSVILPVTADSE